MARNATPKQLDSPALELVAARFKALGEPTRLRLVLALRNGEHTVTELVGVIGAGQANVSRHLQTLAEAGILKRRKAGPKVFYDIGDRSIFTLCEQVFGSLQKQALQQVKAFGRQPPD